MGWVVSATLRPLYSQERPGTHCTGGWVLPRAGLDGCGKSRPGGIRSQDHLAEMISFFYISETYNLITAALVQLKHVAI
jgi:hypothetical protein